MTEQHTFEIELVTADGIDDSRARQTVEQFLSRLMQTDTFDEAKLREDRTEAQNMIEEHERKRLIEQIRQLDKEQCSAAVTIAEDLSNKDG